jgi:hypothetical protein
MVEKKVGHIEEIQYDVQGAGNFVRVKVKLDVRKVLERFVSMIREGKREVFLLKYEKMPRFCAACGFIGHSHLECGTGEHDEANLKWGDYFKADWDTWYVRGGYGARGGGRGGRGGRGEPWSGGRGRDIFGRGCDSFGRGRDLGGRGTEAAGWGDANNTSWRYNAIQYIDGTAIIDPALKDTATSPLKGRNMEIDDEANPIAGAKRNLTGVFSEVGVPGSGGDGAIPPVAMTIGDSNVNAMLPRDGKDDDNVSNVRPKRTKTDGADSSSLGSASSREELVRSQ